MIAILVFVGITSAAAILGALIYRVVPRTRLLISIPARIGLGLIVIMMSAIGYFWANLSFPAYDEVNSSALDSIELDIDIKTKEVRIDERAGPDSFGPIDVVSDLVYRITYPRNVRTEDDATIALSVSAPVGPLPYRREYRAGLSSGDKFDPHGSNDNCGTDPLPGKNDACAKTSGAGKQLEFAWTATPTAGGRRELSMRLPQLWENDTWTAVIRLNGNLLISCVQNHEPLGLDGDRGCRRRAHLLSAETASYASTTGDLSVNLNNQEVRFPIEVTTTLGLSSTTYAWLAAFGIFLSGGLGSGWVFKIIELIRKKPSTDDDDSEIELPEASIEEG